MLRSDIFLEIGFVPSPIGYPQVTQVVILSLFIVVDTSVNINHSVGNSYV